MTVKRGGWGCGVGSGQIRILFCGRLDRARRALSNRRIGSPPGRLEGSELGPFYPLVAVGSELRPLYPLVAVGAHAHLLLQGV